MRKFAYAIFQVALDVLVTLLFLRPYVETASFFSGKLAALGTIILMIVPTITATLLFVVDNLGKEEKNKKKFMLLIFAILVISNMEGKDTPRSFINVFFDWGLAMTTWRYLCTAAADASWTKIIPEWGIITITLVIVLLSVFLQYAGERFLKGDAIIGVVIAGSATMAWFIMDQKGYMADNRSLRVILLILFSGLFYFGVLYFGERIASEKK